jgi:hypothetical protein
MDRIGDEVRRELSRFGGSGAMADIVEAWPETVGAVVAGNAWPARLARDGTLHVNAASSTWAFELQQLEPEISERLKQRLGGSAPSRFRFAPGPLPELPPADPEAVRRPPPEPTLEHAREAREWAGQIESEELRKSVEKAARMSLASAADDRSVW